MLTVSRRALAVTVFALSCLALTPSHSWGRSDDDPLQRHVRRMLPEPATIREGLAWLTAETGLTFVLDDGVDADTPIDPGLDRATARRYLEVICLQAGVFHEEVEDGIFIVAPDNATHRRRYEQHVVRRIVLEHADARKANAMLRGLLAVRSTAVDEALNAITIRDLDERAAVAANLVRAFDQPPAEVHLAIELVSLTDDAVRSLRSRRSRTERGVPLIVQDSDLQQLERAKQLHSLAATTLGLADRKPGSTRASDGDGVALNVEATAQVHGSAREVTLSLSSSLSARSALGTTLLRDQASTVRLASGTTVLLPGLAPTAADDSPGTSVLPLSALFDPERSGATDAGLAIAVTPVVTSWPVEDQQLAAGLSIGSWRTARREQPDRGRPQR